MIDRAQTREPDYYRPLEAASIARVTSQTLIRWAKEGTVTAFVLPSGHRRYLASDIDRIAKTGVAPK